jgi:transcriptional regulator with XRE-family HTH domain
MNLHERLKEERERLGFSQTKFAALADASKHAQINWEKGQASPNAAALAAWATVGLDVRYVVTGEREGPAPLALSAEEETLLGYFRDATKEVRRAALGALLGASAQSFEGSQQVFRKAVKGDVAGRDIVKGGGKR